MKSFLMTPGNAQKCHGGTKVQTRRLIKPQPDEWYSHILVGNYHPTMVDKNGEEYPGEEIFGAYTEDGEWGWECPYSIGSLVYIKETHYRVGCWKPAFRKGKPAWAFTPLTDDILFGDNPPETICHGMLEEGWYKRPSLFLPTDLARTIVEITDIRAQRVQDILLVDCWDEGIQGRAERRVPEFHRLWDSIHGEGAWERNEWVFAYSFRRME